MKLKSLLVIVLIAGFLHAPARAAEYEIDPEHSFVEFRIQHLGYSWLYGRFNDVSGSYNYDAENPEASEIAVQIDPASVDTNHAKRDKHVRSEDFLDVNQYPNASFKSTGYEGTAEAGTLTGELTFHGVTRTITIEMTKLGEGKDPWGGYRSGFVGTTNIDGSDFGMDYDLGPDGWEMQFELGIEGVRQ